MANSGSGTQGLDPEQQIIFILVGLALVMALFYFSLPYLKFAWMYYARFEGYVTYYLTFDDAVRTQAERLIEWTKTTNSENLSYSMYRNIRHAILAKGLHNYALPALFLPLGYFSYRKWNQYKGIPSMDSLLKTEHKIWPTLEFIKRFNPLLEWQELRGHGRYALTPFTFSVENKIISNYKTRNKNERIFSSEQAEKVYFDILGDNFTSYQSMTGYEKLLLLHIAASELSSPKNPQMINDVYRWSAKLLANTKKSSKYYDEYLSDVLDGFVHFIDTGEIRRTSLGFVNRCMKGLQDQKHAIDSEKQKNPYLQKYSLLEFLSIAPKKHGFNSTILVASMRYVKRKGKFTSSRMVYFKQWDRRLFYMITGAPYAEEKAYEQQMTVSFPTEVLGIFSHYQHELVAKRALAKAYVGTAISGLKSRLIKQNLIGGE